MWVGAVDIASLVKLLCTMSVKGLVPRSVCVRERERERLCKTRNEKDKLIEQLSEIAPWNLLS